MDSSIQNERWNVWTRKDKDGNTVDVTYHDDVRFAEYNSKDETGEYLDPSDYTDIVMGTMAVSEDAEGLLDSMLAQMGFGSGVGEWTPAFTDFSGEKPAEPEPGKDDDHNNDGAGNNGAGGNSGAAGDKNAAAKTGDTWNTAVWAAAALLAAGALYEKENAQINRTANWSLPYDNDKTTAALSEGGFCLGYCTQLTAVRTRTRRADARKGTCEKFVHLFVHG